MKPRPPAGGAGEAAGEQGHEARDPLPVPRAAAALRYRPGHDAAPRVVAAGRGTLAEAILRRAREAGVPVIHSPAAPLLASLPVGEEIPESLYEVVARLLAFALDLDRRLAERWDVAPGGTRPRPAGHEPGPIRGNGG